MARILAVAAVRARRCSGHTRLAARFVPVASSARRIAEVESARSRIPSRVTFSFLRCSLAGMLPAMTRTLSLTLACVLALGSQLALAQTAGRAGDARPSTSPAAGAPQGRGGRGGRQIVLGPDDKQ